MPILEPSYVPTRWLRNPHLQTIYAPLFRQYRENVFTRTRLETWDDDFLDLDWATLNRANLNGAAERRNHLVILSHGLEGSSTSVYMVRMALALINAGFDVLAWNFRGCSGEPNRLISWYHSGKTEDLDFVVQHVRNTTSYETLSLVGFSAGGNLTLKWLGEQGSRAAELVSSAVTVSVPCDLGGAAGALDAWQNVVYMKRFLISLRAKVREKARRFPGRLSLDGLEKITTFEEFDERYTAPLHGFPSVTDFWRRASCLPVLPEIKVPSLLVNALDDSFLTSNCFPFEVARDHPYLFLETPTYGGHVGFASPGSEYSWFERRTVEFLTGPC